VALTEVTRSDQNFVMPSRPAIIGCPRRKDARINGVNVVERGEVSLAEDFVIEEGVGGRHGQFGLLENRGLWGSHGLRM